MLLLALFAGLMLVRAVVVTWRDVRLAELQIGFLEAQRGSVAELLGAARWDRLVRLRHARITHLMERRHPAREHRLRQLPAAIERSRW